jgi:hypothetical protein
MAGNHENSDDEPLMRYRFVTFLECSPGNRHSRAGEPVTIVTVAHGEEIEAVSLNVDDTKKLVIDCLISLSFHDNQFANYLLNKYFMKSPDNTIGPFEDEWLGQ